MSSGVTLSGINNIDFSMILNAVMAQERLPLKQLEEQKEQLESQKSTFGTLASKLGALLSASDDLRGGTAFQSTSATVSDPTRLALSAGSGTPEGTYEIYVDALARAQVTTSATTYADKNQTIVASGGTFTVNGVDVVIAGDVTLEGLASAINGTSGIGVTASVIHNNGQYQLMLTGRQTGAANGFTVVNALAGGAGLTLNATNAQEAADAQARVNGVAVTSSTNTFEGVVAGTSFTTLRADPTTAVTITITASNESVKAMVDTLVTAFNETVKFLTEQSKSADGASIGRDALVRGLRRELASALMRTTGAGTFTSLAEVGFTFTRTGELDFDASRFETALGQDKAGVEALFRGPDGTGGVFGALTATIKTYTDAGGLVLNAQERIDSQVTKLTKRIDDFEARLAIKRAALQREYAAADALIAQLNSAGSSLSSLNKQYSMF
ncbi:MAG: flagellar filament capping protein FliD [Vicinamibacteraceae bacterium]|nr:flagellar filament capping protein FliD [Vicinamibacteraceae bacterium]